MAKAVFATAQPTSRADVARGRDCFERRAWADAYEGLSGADRAAPLAAGELEMLAVAAVLTGRDKDYYAALDRAYHAHLAGDEPMRAARSAFWCGFRLLHVGEHGAGAGWIGRAGRLVDQAGGECAERGYLLLPLINRSLAQGEVAAALELAEEAARLGERFEEDDLLAFARNVQGRALIGQGHIEQGLAFLDEAMVAVSSREVSPVVTGIIYCMAIDACHSVYRFDRAREWASALSAWCEAQSQLVTFNGRCLAHRAELKQLAGDWPEAIAEARGACSPNAMQADRAAAGAAFYQEAEVHRLRGDAAQAEDAYLRASELGTEPQPGLALLRLAQGQAESAAAAIGRVLDSAQGPLARARHLPAFVEIMLQAGDVERALAGAKDLRGIASGFESEVMGAMADHAQGAVALAAGDARGALGLLRGAFEVWNRTGAPYIAARLRVLAGLACRELGDQDSARLEFAAARAAFRQLGAAPDVARVDALTKVAREPHPLTPRERQVLGRVAAGLTNRAIAGELGLSEKTVDRHVSNIFVKLDVPSRAAATAEAYKRKLI